MDNCSRSSGIKKGPRIDPCGTSNWSSAEKEIKLLILTQNLLSQKLKQKGLWLPTVSKTAVKSNRTSGS